MLQSHLNPEETYLWIRNQAERSNFEIELYTQAAEIMNGLIRLPVYLKSDLDVFDTAMALQELEDSWNNQEPRPQWHLIIVPAGPITVQEAA